MHPCGRAVESVLEIDRLNYRQKAEYTRDVTLEKWRCAAVAQLKNILFAIIVMSGWNDIRFFYKMNVFGDHIPTTDPGRYRTRLTT